MNIQNPTAQFDHMGEDPQNQHDVAVLNELNCYISDFMQNYNAVCSEFLRNRMTAGHELNDKLRRHASGEVRKQLSADFVDATIRANLECAEKLFGVYSELMANMMSLAAARSK